MFFLSSIFFTDCPSINAHIDYNDGDVRCIIISNQSLPINFVTGKVTACQELGGPDASLIELPDSDMDRWTYVTELLEK